MTINSSPLISVIIPVFNAERFIKRALESVCNQTYKNLEIIVIDDGSTDSSRDIIDSFKDERVQLFSRENKGLIATLNEGIDRCNGDFIARMDADDICSVTRFEKQFEYLLENPSVGAVFTGIEHINEKGETINIKRSGKTRFIEPVELIFGCPVCHPTAMFDLTKMDKDEIVYNDSYHLAEDFELWTRIISKTKIGLLNEVLFKYRVHPNSITSKHGLRQREIAVKALNKNLIKNSNVTIRSSLSVIYNNHLGHERLEGTLFSLLYIGVMLKRINYEFSYKKFISLTYHLLRKKITPSKKKELRS